MPPIRRATARKSTAPPPAPAPARSEKRSKFLNDVASSSAINNQIETKPTSIPTDKNTTPTPLPVPPPLLDDDVTEVSNNSINSNNDDIAINSKVTINSKDGENSSNVSEEKEKGLGKGKKMVKRKVVKVVKVKVIKKVPKKVKSNVDDVALAPEAKGEGGLGEGSCEKKGSLGTHLEKMEVDEGGSMSVGDLGGCGEVVGDLGCGFGEKEGFSGTLLEKIEVGEGGRGNLSVLGGCSEVAVVEKEEGKCSLGEKVGSLGSFVGTHVEKVRIDGGVCLEEEERGKGDKGLKEEEKGVLVLDREVERMEGVDECNVMCKKEGKGETSGKGDEENKLWSGELVAMERRTKRRRDVFIGGLDREARGEDVRKVMGEARKIEDVKVVLDLKTWVEGSVGVEEEEEEEEKRGGECGKGSEGVKEEVEEKKGVLVLDREVERMGVDECHVMGKIEEKGETSVKGDEEKKLWSGELEAMERRKKRRREVFIGGLDRGAKEEDVRKAMAEAGEIEDVKVVLDLRTGMNKGFGFVTFVSAEDAKKALELFEKVEICGKQCRVSPVEGNDTIFLGNIDKKWRDEDVTRLLQQIGIEKIDKVIVMIDPNNNECNRGFAFVEFETSNAAQIAYKKFQQKERLGKYQQIKVAWAAPLKEFDEEEMRKVKTVYAEFLPSSWDEEKVKDTFGKFGEIEGVVLAQNLRSVKRKDFAFISYKTREAALHCIESSNNELRDEDGIKVNVKVSLAKPLPQSRKPKPAAFPLAMEVPKQKANSYDSNLRQSEASSRVQPTIPHFHNPIPERTSTSRVQPTIPHFRNPIPERTSTIRVQPTMPHFHNPIPERTSTSRVQPTIPHFHNPIPERTSTSRVQPTIPHFHNPIPERKSTNAELVHLLREQASWRPSHQNDQILSSSPPDTHYSLSGRKRHFSLLEADPPYPDLIRHSSSNTSFPVGRSSSNMVPFGGDTSSLSYHHRHGGYPSGSHNAATYDLNTDDSDEIRERARGSNILYRRY